MESAAATLAQHDGAEGAAAAAQPALLTEPAAAPARKQSSVSARTDSDASNTDAGKAAGLAVRSAHLKEIFVAATALIDCCTHASCRIGCINVQLCLSEDHAALPGAKHEHRRLS